MTKVMKKGGKVVVNSGKILIKPIVAEWGYQTKSSMDEYDDE